MNASPFALYSAVGTQSAMALLLACALYMLGRYYPRSFLRLWTAAWLAEAVHMGMGMVALYLRVAPSAQPAPWPALATWLSQFAGLTHGVLLVAGALAMYQGRAVVPHWWKLALPVLAIVAVGPAFLLPETSSVTMRVFVRVGLLSVWSATAFLISALLISRARRVPASLGVRWMYGTLLVFVIHDALQLFLVTTSGPVNQELVQGVPMVSALLMAALGIATAIAMVEDEQEEVRRGSARQLEAERRVRASGASLVSALAAVPDLVAVVGADGRLTAWNPAFEHFAARSGGAAPAVGVEVVATLAGSPGSEWGRRIRDLLDGRDQEFEATFEIPDATPEYFDVSARPMRDADGAGPAVVGGVIVARDVTERRKLEQQLQQAQRLDTVGRLAGGIAHDFNNLLTAILSSASVARECLPADHEVQADLADVQLAGERATQLTRQLLAFARRQPVSQQPIELNDRVATMERMLSRLVGPDVALRVALGENLWHVRADGPQLEQVLVNVTVNARDAMPNGGRLSIRTANRTLADGAIVLPRPMPAGDYVEIVITDSGAGMDEETLTHVFEPFYTTKPVGQGTGLGLAMCYGIIRQHHGVIWIESAPGRGTSVFILLPRYEGALPVRAERQASLTPALVSSGTETVLLVEDEPQVRAVAARALRAAGYRVLEATNGRDGLQVARRERGAIDLIVSDVVMPEMGGKEMVELARQFLPAAAVLFVSGYTAGSFPNATDDPSASIFLQKPFTPQELLEMVRQVLDRHSAAREASTAIAS